MASAQPAESKPEASTPLALVALYPGAALAAIAVLVALLAVAWRRAPPGQARALGRPKEEGDPEIEALIAAINAPAT